MSTSRFTMVMVLAACGAGSSADTLMPDFMRQPGDSANTTPQAKDAEAASFLADATANTSGLGWQLAATQLQGLRQALPAAQPASPQDADPAELLSALTLLGHDRVLIAYFQALTEPRLFMAYASGGEPTPNDRRQPGSKARPTSGAPDGARIYRATAAPKTAQAEQRDSGALADGLAGELWLYLVATAAVAAAALGLARLLHSSGSPQSRRLARL